jgi:hypothetical protein
MVAVLWDSRHSTVHLILFSIYSGRIRISKSRRIRQTGHAAFMGGIRNACSVVGKPGRKRPLRWLRRKLIIKRERGMA